MRPRDFAAPLVVGTLYLDAASARAGPVPVQLHPRRLSRPAARGHQHRAGELAVRARYWLPYRQEIEIRRRTTWLDFPARGIIRGRWEIGDYDSNSPLPDRVFAGPRSAGCGGPGPGDPPGPCRSARRSPGVAPPLNRQDMDALRVEVERIAGGPRAGRAAGPPAGGRLAQRHRAGESGAGAHARLRRRARARGSRIRSGRRSGTAPRMSGSRAGSPSRRASGATQVSLRREPADPRLQRPAGHRAGSQLVLAQEGGQRLRRLRAAPRRRRRTAPPAQRADHARASSWRSRRAGRSSVRASPANGRYRPNPALGVGHVPRRPGRRSSGRAAASRSAGPAGAAAVEARRGPERLPPGRRARAAGSTRLGGAQLLSRGLPRRGHRRAARLPELRARRTGDAGRRAVPGLRRPDRGAGRRWNGGSRCRCRRIPLGSFAIDRPAR